MTLHSDFGWSGASLESHFKRHKLTQNDVAEAIFASQSQVSRVFSGRTSLRSKLAIDICNYASSLDEKTKRARMMRNDELMDALASVWDGSPAHARALAGVIRSLIPLTPRMIRETDQ